MPQYSWVIVGGGLHGVFHAHNLVIRKGYSPESICIVDPEPHLLHRWLQQCHRCGMEHLRSSSSHCLSTDFRDLRRYAALHSYPADHFLQPYSRPSLELFTAHSRSCIEASRLDGRHIRDRIRFIKRNRQGWTAAGETMQLAARNVLLAPGRVPPPLPDWAGDMSQERIAVLLNPAIGTGVDGLSADTRIAVVGGGITGVGAAVYSADRRSSTRAAAVDLFCSRPPEADLFDFDPGYVGPRRQPDFTAADPLIRAQLVRSARNRGTATPELLNRLCRHIDSGRVRVRVETVQQAGQVAGYDRVLIAGGTGSETPALIRQTAAANGLPFDGTGGYPALREDCSWTGDLYVSGAAAQGVIGPAAPNIIGAHLAFRRMHRMRTMRA